MMDKDYLYQIDIREWIERGLDADIMVPVSGNKIDKKYDIYLQSFLLPLNEVENDMENDTYNAHTLMPGITVYGSWEDDEKVYHRWGNDNGYEPLVIKNSDRHAGAVQAVCYHRNCHQRTESRCRDEGQRDSMDWQYAFTLGGYSWQVHSTIYAEAGA